jgi:hypothetical protein
LTTAECALQQPTPANRDAQHCGCLAGKSIRQLLQPTPTGQRGIMMGHTGTESAYLRTATGLRLTRNRNCVFRLYDVKVDFDEKHNCLKGDGACDEYDDRNWAAGECGSATDCPTCSSSACADPLCNDVRLWQCALQSWSANAACDLTHN